MNGPRELSARSRELSARLPAWAGSIRFRLALLYSLVLFGLAGLVVGGLYLGVSRSLRDEPVTREMQVHRVYRDWLGRTRAIETFVLADVQAFERTVNQRTLEQLGRYSVWSLGGLFVASLGVGWMIAGRVLAPISRITDVARDIQATDLSRRIALQGPRDELRQLADTFDEMLSRLDQAFDAQRRFVADASHELRNPLAVMGANLDLALADPDADPEEVRRLTATARRTVERMSRLVEDLLLLARQGSPSARTERVDVGVLAGEVAEELGVPAAGRGVSIEHRLAGGEVVVTGDPDALRRAVANVVDNAVRFAPTGSVVEVVTAAEHDRARVSVHDDGPGVAPEDRERAFDRFWRSDAGRSRADGGAGLGLAIVRQIVEAHGGRVELRSEPADGTTVELTFPVRLEEISDDQEP